MLDVGLFWHFINTFNRVKYKIKVASVLLRQRWLSGHFQHQRTGIRIQYLAFFFYKTVVFCELICPKAEN